MGNLGIVELVALTAAADVKWRPRKAISLEDHGGTNGAADGRGIVDRTTNLGNECPSRRRKTAKAPKPRDRCVLGPQGADAVAAKALCTVSTRLESIWWRTSGQSASAVLCAHASEGDANACATVHPTSSKCERLLWSSTMRWDDGRSKSIKTYSRVQAGRNRSLLEDVSMATPESVSLSDSDGVLVTGVVYHPQSPEVFIGGTMWLD